MRALVGTGAGLVLLLLAGHGLLRLATGSWPHRAYGVTGAVGLSWFAGVAVLGTLTTLSGVLGGSTRPLPVLAPVLAVLAVAGAVPLPAGLRRASPPPAATTRLGDAVAGAAGIVAAAWIALLGARIPVASNDEYALWMLKARTLSQLGELDPRVFTDTGAGYQHQTYPLFLPSLFGWLDGWAGRPSDAAAHLAVAVTVGALLAVAGAVLTRLAGPAAAAVSLVLVVSVPTLSRQSLLLMADVPVFAFAFCLALVLMVVLALPAEQPAGPWLVAATVLGAGAIGTKAEGLAFAGIAFAAALLLATGRRRAVILAGVAAGLANAPWQVYARQHELRNWVLNEDTLSADHLRVVLPWTGHVLRGMAERWPGGAGWGALLVVAAVPAAVLAVRAGRWRLVAFAAAVVLLDTAVLAAQYVVTAYGPESDPLSGRLLESQLDVTVFRVALVPAALLAIAVPVFAGLALRAARPTPTSAPADPTLVQPVMARR